MENRNILGRPESNDSGFSFLRSDFYELDLSFYRRNFGNRLGNRFEIHGKLDETRAERFDGRDDDCEFLFFVARAENTANRDGLRSLDRHRNDWRGGSRNAYFRRAALNQSFFVHFANRRRNRRIETNFRRVMKFSTVSFIIKREVLQKN